MWTPSEWHRRRIYEGHFYEWQVQMKDTFRRCSNSMNGLLVKVISHWPATVENILFHLPFH